MAKRKEDAHLNDQGGGEHAGGNRPEKGNGLAKHPGQCNKEQMIADIKKNMSGIKAKDDRSRKREDHDQSSNDLAGTVVKKAQGTGQT